MDVLVIGAGPTGVGAATALAARGADWLLVEAGAGPGGMAGSVTDEHGFTWDLGGHVLHSHFADFDRAIEASGVELLQPVRSAWIWIDGTLVNAPIQHQLDELPTDLDPDAPAANLDDYYRNNLGSQLHARFFKPFTEKMWATPLERVDHTWTSLRSGSVERNVPMVRLKDDMRGGHSTPVTFPYPAGGTGKLWDAIAAPLDPARMRYGTRVVAIDLDARAATLDTGERIRFGDCVSSMPITTLMHQVGRPDMAAQAPSLLCNEVLVIGLGFAGAPPPAFAGTTWFYCPDKEVAWHRATVLSNYDPANAGEGRWSVLCEVGHSAFRRIDTAETVANCQQAVAALGADLTQLVSCWVKEVPMGYPVPTLGRDALLHELDDTFRAAGIHSRGRFGGWRYESCNQDYSFAQGVEAVAAIAHGSAEDVYWHPERF